MLELYCVGAVGTTLYVVCGYDNATAHEHLSQVKLWFYCIRSV